jgi:glutaconate CoA-transferase, subunit B
VDFITSPGHRYRGVRRDELGLPGAGPVRVITDRGILEAEPESGELVLSALYPGNSVDDVRSRVGWPLRVREPLGAVEPPTADVLVLLRALIAGGQVA